MTLSNPDVVRFLNHEVIPYWESVRAVPQVKIDFGDGRVLNRTLGGNVVLSLLLPDGRVVDSYPGVYTPEDLLAQIRVAMTMIRELGAQASDSSFIGRHKQAMEIVRTEIAITTLSKAVVESPMLQAMSAPTGAVEADRNVVRLRDISKEPLSVNEIQSLLGVNGEAIVRADSLNNVMMVRPEVHRLFARYSYLPSLEQSKKDMYEKILHIKLDDPYLGLKQIVIPGTR